MSRSLRPDRGFSRMLRYLILIYAGAGSGEVPALCTVTGSIEGPAGPLPDVRVSVVRNSGSKLVATSGADGSFTFSIEPLRASLRHVQLEIYKEGFIRVERLLKPDESDACPVLQPDRIPMVPVPEATAGEASFGGNTLFVAAHEIYPPDHPGTRIATSISKRFGAILFHYIRSYVSSLDTNYDIPGIRQLDEPLPFFDVERIRREGRERNALAVIAGEGEVAGSDSQSQQLHLVSEFRIIPLLPGYRERRFQLQDSLQLRDASAFSISRDLRDLWGQKTIVAVVVRELARMHPPYDRQRLQEARRTLLEVRRTVSEQDAIYLEVQALLDWIEKELQT